MKQLLIALLLMSCSLLQAQQQVQFSQFGNFRQYYNPAHAGSFEGGSISVLHRSQWVGLDGAPSTQAITFDVPLLYGRVGIGGNLYRTSIGVSESWTLDGAYAYRMPLKKVTFSLGLQASLRYWGVNYADSRLHATQGIAIDEDIPDGMQSRFLPNFGVGIYLSNDNFYLGLSAPRIIEANIDFSEEASNNLGQEVRHFYGMAGALIPLGEVLALRPQALLKVADQAPMDADFSLGWIVDAKYGLSFLYRLGGSSDEGIGEAFAIQTQVQISDKILMGISYDIGMSTLRSQHDGSWEFLMRYAFNPPQGNTVLNPRYF